MKKLILICVLMFLIAGCAANGYWTRSDFDPVQWQTDRYECDHNAQVASQYWNPRQDVFTAIMAYQYNFKNCIQARGYYWVSIK